MRRVVVTGLGAITPLGVGLRTTWTRLLASHSGLVSTTNLPLPTGAPPNAWAALPSQVAGLIPTGQSENDNPFTLEQDAERSTQSAKAQGRWDATDWLSKSEIRAWAKYTQYAVAATEEALDDAGWGTGRLGKWSGAEREMTMEEREMTGVCMGSGIGNFEEVYQTSLAYSKGGAKKVSPLFVPQLLINLAAGHISIRHGFRGPNHAVTTACTTGAHSIGDAARFIACGDANVMVAGGSESCIHPLAIAGFSRSRSLATEYNRDPGKASRPFDVDRCGFVIAEGAGVMILEELEHALRRGARIYAEVKGYGCSGDSHHITAPAENGAGALLAMRKALRNAKLKPASVGYINAHATSTPLGDAAEVAAVRALMLGEEGLKHAQDITISSTKGALGHLLGAAGAVEAILAVMAIHESKIPPTLNLERLSPGFDFNFVSKKSQEKCIDVAMTNSFGFGGTNASLVFAKYKGSSISKD